MCPLKCSILLQQLKMKFVLWSRVVVLILIEEECGIMLPIRAAGNYLQRWSMSPQKPIRRAYEQSAPL